ncbi:MAG: metallophosphoesterase [Acidimicrobiales bacterium]|nr:metallophosphoesterase [Acidimicrobiales bacterium]
MTGARVIVVSDSHLSDRTPEATANWSAVVDDVAAARPSLVVHAGDVTADGAEHPADLLFARAQLDRIPVPLAIVPGNHDVGDVPAPGSAAGPWVDATRLERFRSAFGADRFSVAVGRWHVLGIDAQLLAAGGDAEAEQWDWLEAEVARLRPGTPVMVVSHRPLIPPPGEVDHPGRYVRPPAQARLIDLLGDMGPRMVVSGHVHQRLHHRTGGMDHAWAPTTWAVLPDGVQTRVGDKEVGVLDLVLHDHGAVDVTTRVPDGMRQMTLGIDIVDPYGRATARTSGV